MYVAEEHSIYGSSRVGVDNRKDTLYKAGNYSPSWGGISTSRRDLGSKSFELANHLGNVLVTVSDKPVYKVSSGTIYFQPEITSISDYYPFGAPMPGRNFSLSSYRYGFNGKENDGESETQDYGMRINDFKLGRFLSVDPLKTQCPMLTPYQFASNSPISGIDLDGLEYYYAADGKFIGQGGDRDNKEVRLGKITGKTKSGKNSITRVDLKGQVQSQWTVIHNNHDDFKVLAGVLYAEADGTTSEAVDEVAGIYSVLENRANYERTSIEAQLTIKKGVFGISEADKINQADITGMTAKKEAVFSGLIKGRLSKTDFSNGAFYWDGTDFENGGGHIERYKPGFQFTDRSHDLFNLGDNKKPGTANGVTWDYKFQSTGAIGKTTFSKLTDKWRDAQFPGAGKGKQVGNGKEL
jgi:RHS repeat-associated protein